MKKRNVSNAELRRLRLRDGDILLVRDVETLKSLIAAGTRAADGKIYARDVQIVYAPTSVHRLSREYLEKLLARSQ